VPQWLARPTVCHMLGLVATSGRAWPDCLPGVQVVVRAGRGPVLQDVVISVSDSLPTNSPPSSGAECAKIKSLQDGTMGVPCTRTGRYLTLTSPNSMLLCR
jgi:hypothetical protein